MTVIRILLLILVPFITMSQTITTSKELLRIDGHDTAGYEVEVSAGEAEVKASLSRFLKTIGRTRSSGDYITIASPVINGKANNGTLYATTKRVGVVTAAWIGFPTQGGEAPDLDRELEMLARDFGIAFNREKIQSQINESLRALDAVEKQHTRLLNQNRDLNNKLEHNKRQKIALEKSLVENKVEFEDLNLRLAANAEAQDSIAVATEQIRKVVEMHKAKQQSIR